MAQDSLTVGLRPVHAGLRRQGGPQEAHRRQRRGLRRLRLGAPEQFSFKGWNGETVYGYVVKPASAPTEEVPAGVPHSRRAAGQLRQPLALPLEPAELRGARLRGGDDRLPRLDWVRPGLHRRDHRRLGRQAAGGPAEGPRRRAREVPLHRQVEDVRAGRQLRRLHGQLDRRELERAVEVPGRARRQPRRALRVLRHRGALVPRVGARRHALGEPRRSRKHNPIDHVAKWKTPMLVVHGGNCL